MLPRSPSPAPTVRTWRRTPSSTSTRIQSRKSNHVQLAVVAVVVAERLHPDFEGSAPRGWHVEAIAEAMLSTRHHEEALT
jgi:hypothetical protein